MGMTILLLRKENKILLAMKKRRFGEGKYNGIGGKIEPGETPEEAMIRETQEEIFVTPTQYYKVGVLDYMGFYGDIKTKEATHLYVATEWIGDPKESEEMKPEWFDIDKIPYDKMFADDKYWFPYILANKKINALFDFDENWNVLSYKIDEIK